MIYLHFTLYLLVCFLWGVHHKKLDVEFWIGLTMIFIIHFAMLMLFGVIK